MATTPLQAGSVPSSVSAVVPRPSEPPLPVLFPSIPELFRQDNEILRAFQLSSLFDDQKTFVDSSLKQVDAAEFEEIFREAFKTSQENVRVEGGNRVQLADEEKLRSLYDNYFMPPGRDIETWVPPDVPNPSWGTQKGDETEDTQAESLGTSPQIHLFSLVSGNTDLKEMTQSLMHAWSLLGRRAKEGGDGEGETSGNSDGTINEQHWLKRHSLLPLQGRPFMVAGGRFREAYYWDTYWIVKGLLLSGMVSTARTVIENISGVIESFGFFPNGLRTYYLSRSQPPLFSEMVKAFLAIGFPSPDPDPTKQKSRGDMLEFLRRMTRVAVKEHLWWINNRAVSLVPNRDGGWREATREERVTPDVITLNRYGSDLREPRPEAYSHDLETAETAAATLGRDRGDVFVALRAAAESGWDFSSRWFPEPCAAPPQEPSAPCAEIQIQKGAGGEEVLGLSDIRTSDVIPLDLNAFLYRMEINIAEWADRLVGFEEGGKQLETAEQRAEEGPPPPPSQSEWRQIASRMRTAAAARRQNMRKVFLVQKGEESLGRWGDLVLPPSFSTPLKKSGKGAGEVRAKGSWVNTGALSAITAPWAGLCDDQTERDAVLRWTFRDSGLWVDGEKQVGGEGQEEAPERVEEGQGSFWGPQATTVFTGQQWDAPNVWPPLVDMCFETLVSPSAIRAAGLGEAHVSDPVPLLLFLSHKSPSSFKEDVLEETAQRMGETEWLSVGVRLGQRMLETVLAGWKRTGTFFEKYHCTLKGTTGALGEYEPQTGFGWTNGMSLQLLSVLGLFSRLPHSRGIGAEAEEMKGPASSTKAEQKTSV
uniref:Trehalase n=1 Tax=Chromera velia CCMP2878 TaxID=1169474 RepID=A0A0G4HKB5_9ALVE|eukprot:Cvel_7263.t1-p1 / transcript=Cvel_7263.t1 / gene=Cvel_7263 / organism=Chromera_velia_CCMP2878 / gene_product=Trehalase, putative / transcript_product=Trehalase, putative / location=Cvel_scaffold375:41606-45097(-) / protein_length=817 / sequence_SO=supercontig / SO=protein_coding / is_pseudo=false